MCALTLPGNAVPAGYEALRTTAAWADLGMRTTLFATGPDAVKFIDNFTTAAVGGLQPGTGTEGFFADAKGWVLALASIFRTPDGVWIDAAALPQPLHPHLERYHIRERLELVDASTAESCLLLAGPESPDRLAALGGAAAPTNLLDHAALVIAGIPAAVARIDWLGVPGFLLRVAAADRGRLAEALGVAGIPEATAAAVDVARIEAGRPEPADIVDKTLPQELGRDARAISFTKGCYLGQETVARIDALGHVNRRFVAVSAPTPIEPGAVVTADGEPIGTVTSACLSPRAGAWLGLVIALTKKLGGAIAVDGAPARVVPLPVAERRDDGGNGDA